jgi:hypothetical protein
VTVATLDPFAYFLLVFGGLLLLLAASAGVIDWIVGADDAELDEPVPDDPEWADYPYAGYPPGRDGEPTDDEIYNGPGREGGIVYDRDDEPGSLGEHDWRL